MVFKYPRILITPSEVNTGAICSRIMLTYLKFAIGNLIHLSIRTFLSLFYWFQKKRKGLSGYHHCPFPALWVDFRQFSLMQPQTSPTFKLDRSLPFRKMLWFSDDKSLEPVFHISKFKLKTKFFPLLAWSTWWSVNRSMVCDLVVSSSRM